MVIGCLPGLHSTTSTRVDYIHVTRHDSTRHLHRRIRPQKKPTLRPPHTPTVQWQQVQHVHGHAEHAPPPLIKSAGTEEEKERKEGASGGENDDKAKTGSMAEGRKENSRNRDILGNGASQLLPGSGSRSHQKYPVSNYVTPT